MKQYDAYLFDWDGTLARTLPVWLTAIQDGYAQYGITATVEEIGSRLGDWQATVEPLPVAVRDRFREQAEATANAQLAKPPLYKDALELLQALKAANKKLALITTTKREAIDMVLSHHELVPLFDIVITGDEVAQHKPSPEGIFAALNHLGIEKDRAVMLGDSDKDLGAAKNASVDSVLFYPESHKIIHSKTHLESFGPVKVVTAWSELMRGAKA
jgi:pyrophosphatase PpaX